MMDFYEKMKSIFCMDLSTRMMHVIAKILRFYNYFDLESVAYDYQRNSRDKNYGTNVGKFENPVSGSPSNRPGHEIFPESGIPVILGMVIFPREGGMNTCYVMETQGIEHDRDRVDFYNEVEGLVPT